jgi:hypothetical protein
MEERNAPADCVLFKCSSRPTERDEKTAEFIAYCFLGSYLTAVTEAIGPLTTLPECRSVKEKPASFPDFLVE